MRRPQDEIRQIMVRRMRYRYRSRPKRAASDAKHHRKVCDRIVKIAEHYGLECSMKVTTRMMGDRFYTWEINCMCGERRRPLIKGRISRG